MGLSPTGNKAHDAQVAIAEAAHQIATSGTVTQAQVKAADLLLAKAILVSAATNGLNIAVVREQLAELDPGSGAG